MQVVHGLWTTTKREGPGLVIWLEDASARLKTQLFEPISDFLPGGKPTDIVRLPNVVEDHPFAVDLRQIPQTARGLLKPSFGGGVPVFSPTTIELRLPSLEDAPLPSLRLGKHFFNKDPKAKPVVMLPWRVAAVHLPPHVALKWLMTLNLRLANPDFSFSESIQFWKDATRLVFYSLMHGTYEPLLLKVDHQIKCKWVLNIKILANQLENMEKRMPEFCEAEYSSECGRRTKESIIRDFFDTSIDHLVRHVSGHRVLEEAVAKRLSKKRKKQNPLDTLVLPHLKALYSRQNSFSAARDVQAAYVAMVSNWLRQIGKSYSRQWQTAFTIIPPEIGNTRIEEIDPKLKVWRVAFSLRSIKDNSHHIYAQEIWENLVPTQTGNGETLSEFLLKDLGRALQYFPGLRAALDEAFPTYVDLNTEDCYRFLTEHSLHLMSADFGVVYPPFWKKDTRRLTTKIQLDSSAFDKKGMLGFDSMINFSWQATVGETQLSERAFHSMVTNKLALLPINGQWVEIEQEDLFSAATFFQDRQLRGEMTLREAVHFGMKSEEMQSAFDDVEFDYKGSIAQLFANGADELPGVAQPVNLEGTLRPYQLRGLSWLAFMNQLGFGACLADDMGLGKTIQLLSMLLHERESGQVKLHSRPTLLVCPMSVVTNWFREAAKFTPSLRVLIHHGSARHSKAMFNNVYERYDLIITTYHLINRDIELFKSVKWLRIALDEAQNIKNPNAQQTKAIVTLEAEKKVALTGTPVENKLSELWSIMEFLNPGYLGTLKSFQSRFGTAIERQGDKKKAGLLRKLTQPFILRRLKTDKTIIQDLPEKIEMKVYCDLTEEQAAIYQAYVTQQLREIESAQGIQRNQLVLTTLMKLKQICNHPAQFMQDQSGIANRSGKLMRLTEMLEEALEEGDKSLIFTQFAKMGDLLKTYLESQFGGEVLYMHGAIPQEKRQLMVDRFQTKNGPKIFVLTVKTGGTGLNLTAATHVFHYDRWWNPAVENQATDRAFRIGQKQSVQVHKLIATGTLEDRIDMMIEKKKELAENIIGADEAWLTQLSTDALREIITLSVTGG